MNSLFALFCALQIILLLLTSTEAYCGEFDAEGCAGQQVCVSPEMDGYGVGTCNQECDSGADCIAEQCVPFGYCTDRPGSFVTCTKKCDLCEQIDTNGTLFQCICFTSDACPGGSNCRRFNKRCLGTPGLFNEPCLSGFSTVETIANTTTTTFVHDLKLGDHVLVNDHDDRYEQVYGFGHVNMYAVAEFFQIHHTNNNNNNNKQQALELTGEHLIYKLIAGSVAPVRADSIQVGDTLALSSTRNNNEPVTVTRIDKITRSGIYSPMTPSGYFMAGNSQVSVYTATSTEDPQWWLPNLVSYHFLNHISITPYRWMCNSHWHTSDICSQRNDKGQLLYAAVGEQLLVQQQQQSTTTTWNTVWLFGILVVFGLQVPLYFLEQLIAASNLFSLCGIVGIVLLRTISKPKL